jgi:hypothetical protein
MVDCVGIGIKAIKRNDGRNGWKDRQKSKEGDATGGRQYAICRYRLDDAPENITPT